MLDVAIVDYGMCNLDSVKRAVEECGGKATITNKYEDLSVATHIILPGVGAFGEAMENIRRAKLDEMMAEQVFEYRIPFLGICLGMQLIAETSEEHGDHAGLGWIDGHVRLMQPDDASERVPHMGWNVVEQCQDSVLLDGVPQNSDFYFVHSYHFDVANEADVVARTPYCGSFVSMVQRDNIFGAQFHPEKSQTRGFEMLKNFLGYGID